MKTCHKCGTTLEDQNRFCFKCGAPQQAVNPPSVPAASSVKETAVAPATAGRLSMDLYRGQGMIFPLLGRELQVSSGMDAFNHYRKLFRRLAKMQRDALEREYRGTVRTLDDFLIRFPSLYGKYRKPMIDLAMKLIMQAGIYDLSPEQFTEQHTADFCLCGEDVDAIVESFNLTLEANQDRKIKMYNLMPGVVFSGLSGFAAALAFNVATSAIAEADIRNANVSQSQRAELFRRINTTALMDRAFTDFWRVFLSMTWQMKQRGIDMWYPDAEQNRRASGLFDNLKAGRIPPEHLPDQIVVLLQLNPYADDPALYIRQRWGGNAETAAIFRYFGYED